MLASITPITPITLEPRRQAKEYIEEAIQEIDERRKVYLLV
jgi:hypothetical protein